MKNYDIVLRSHGIYYKLDLKLHVCDSHEILSQMCFSSQTCSFCLTFHQLKITIGASKARIIYLKKSLLQKSFPSLEKHFSVSVIPQSEHCTHCMCQALSKTFSKNRSRIGRLQPPHCIIPGVSLPIATLTDLIFIQGNSNVLFSVIMLRYVTFMSHNLQKDLRIFKLPRFAMKQRALTVRFYIQYYIHSTISVLHK